MAGSSTQSDVAPSSWLALGGMADTYLDLMLSKRKVQSSYPLDTKESQQRRPLKPSGMAKPEPGMVLVLSGRIAGTRRDPKRAWMGLELKGVPYTLHEVDPYHKSPEFLAVSPRGLVPSVVHQGRSVYESSVVLEYLEEAFPERPRLLAADAYGRALQRIWGDHINKKIVALFYRLLQAQDKEGREAAARGYTEAWRKLFEVYPQAGPFFFGRQPGFIDLMAAPWAARELVLTHFRGYSAPADLKEYHSWWDAMQKHPSFLATKADDEKLIQVYQRYADNSAQSLVAKATRAGTELP